MEIEKRLALKAAGEPRSEWAELALEAAERIESLKRELTQEIKPDRIKPCSHSEN
jgi:hypothetical protein